MMRINITAIAVLCVLIFAACELGGEVEWPEYAVRYNSNGGTGVMADSVHVYGTKKNLSANAYNRTEFRFIGWAKSPAGDVVYTDAQSVLNLTTTPGDTITLYARWAVNAPEMADVEGGSFRMGDSMGAGYDVTVDDFSMGKYPVTQAQFRAVMGYNPSNSSYIAKRPVEHLSWYDAVEFCNTLSGLLGFDPVYQITGKVIEDDPDFGLHITAAAVTADWSKNGYRLPTEAEWEYAAKGGAGPGPYCTWSGSDTADDVAWYAENSDGRIRQVGTKSPNSLDIYDMSGNVWEWCWDWYGAYPGEAADNPHGPASGTERILRGGSFYDPVGQARCIFRNSANPSLWGITWGFRIVRSAGAAD